MTIKVFIISFLLCSSVLSSPNPDENFCGKYVEIVALETHVPPEVIWAVARTESNFGNLGPWPWSANFQGKSFYFKSKKALVNFLHKKIKKNPLFSIDIGCMQLNYLYHGHKFSSVYDMTDIYKNMLISAQYLRKLYEINKHIYRHKNFPKNRIWGYAVGDYHSRRTSRGAKYIKRTSRFLMITPSWYDDRLPSLEDLLDK